MILIRILRTEQTQINKKHPYHKIIDDFCFRSKNLYNTANYIQRQRHFDNQKILTYREMDVLLQKTPQYKSLMSQASQCLLQVLDRCWKSYKEASKDYIRNPHKYLGEPKPPGYKKPNGRYPWFLKNNQSYIKDGHLYFRLKVFNGYGFKTSADGRLISVRFIPRGTIYVLEIVYEKEIDPSLSSESKRISGIDLGIDNFVTMTNNIGKRPIIINGKGIKSINQFYNKRRAKTVSELSQRNGLKWSKRLDSITLKRNNRVKNFMHHSSKYIVEYCKRNDIDVLVVGLNKKWKQKTHLGNNVNQRFWSIPYDMLIGQLEYKCQENGIKLIMTEESYTSGTSFLDDELPIKDNYNKKRRKKRGLFVTENGEYINADVNGSLQIIRKVFPDAFEEGIKGSLVPIKINVVKV